MTNIITIPMSGLRLLKKNK